MRRNSIFLFIATLCLPQFVSAQSYTIPFREEGIASWYGEEFNGRPTASGEAFDSNRFTAAHPTLSFGTFLIVTNKLNNRQVTVTVNDRGPFVPGRIIDLSKAAAQHIDMINAGTVPVIIETMSTTYFRPPEPPPPAPPPLPVYEPEPPPPPEPEITYPPISVITVYPPGQTDAPPTVNITPYEEPPFPASQMAPPIGTPAPSYTAPPAEPVFPPPAQIAPPVTFYPPPQVPFPQYLPPLPPPVPSNEYYPPAIGLLPPPVDYFDPPPVIATEPPPAPPSSGIKLTPAISPSPEKRYKLQIGSYKVPRNAVEAFDKLKKAGLNPSYEQNGDNYRVVLEGIQGTQVQSVSEKLEKAGFREAIIREDK